MVWEPEIEELARRRALDGLLVVEVSHGVAAAYCGRLLAMYGARVVLVEPPGGSALRAVGPFGSADNPRESGALLLTLGAGKQSIAVDLAATGGRQVDRLLSHADVLLTDAAAGLVAAGMDYETLARRNPGIIFTSVSPFGESGPYAGFAATSSIIYALGGYTYITGDPDREPVSGPENLPDYVGGANAYAAVLAAIVARKRTGRGQRIEVSELEGIAAAHQWTLTRYDYNGRVGSCTSTFEESRRSSTSATVAPSKERTAGHTWPAVPSSWLRGCSIPLRLTPSKPPRIRPLLPAGGLPGRCQGLNSPLPRKPSCRPSTTISSTLPRRPSDWAPS